jgi:hypothetical protein
VQITSGVERRAAAPGSSLQFIVLRVEWFAEEALEQKSESDEPDI